MVYIQRNSPPPNQKVPFSIRDFSGGLNNRSTVFEGNEASNIRNMKFSDKVIMEKRLGSVIAGYSPLLSPVTYLDKAKPYNEGEQWIRVSNNRFFAEETYHLDVNGQVDAVNFLGRYFFTDGMYYYVLGKFPQSNSTYEVVYGTPFNGYTWFKMGNPPQGYTPLDTSHTRGKTVYDYNTKNLWYEPCQNELNDPYKGSNVLPQSPSFIVSHKGRVFLSGSSNDDDNVFISDVGNPYYFPTALPIQVPPNSDEVRGLTVFDDGVLVGRKHDIHVIYGTTNNPELQLEMFRLNRLNTHTGFMNNRCLSLAHNHLFYLGYDGNAYGMSSARVKEKDLATQLLNGKVEFGKEPLSIPRADMENCCAVFHDDMWLISMGRLVMVYSYRHQAWTVYDSLNIRSFYLENYTLHWGDENGDLCKWGTDYLDKGKPFEARWESVWIDNGDVTSYKQYREFYIQAHTFDNYRSDIRIKLEVDYLDVDSVLTVTNNTSRWGVARFGDRFINRVMNVSQPLQIGRRARQLRLKFYNGYGVSVTVDNEVDLVDVQGKFHNMLAHVKNGNTFHLYQTGGDWLKVESDDYNQPMRIYEISGEYELRGKR